MDTTPAIRRVECYEVSIHNRAHECGCHFAEDDWEVTGYGLSPEAALNDALSREEHRQRVEELVPDYVYISVCRDACLVNGVLHIPVPGRAGWEGLLLHDVFPGGIQTVLDHPVLIARRRDRLERQRKIDEIEKAEDKQKRREQYEKLKEELKKYCERN